MRSRTLSLCLLFVGLLLGNQTLFSQLVLHSSDQGNIELGPYGMSHEYSSQSYRLGMDPVTSLIGIPYFVFDIPDFAKAIESVTLSIYNPADVNAGEFLLFDQGFDNTSSPAEISLWDYSSDKSMFDTDFNTFFSPPGTTSEWDDDLQDLQSGTKYASTTVDSSSDGSWVNFYLNSDAIIDIWTNQGGQFALGASSENQTGMFGGNELAAPGSQDGGENGHLYPSARLEFNFKNGVALAKAAGAAVPEPSTYGLAGALALTIVIVIRHQRRRREGSFPPVLD